MKIPFSPPDISELEIEEVVSALRSGWITTGPKTKELERLVASYCSVNRAVCLNSQTACAEMALRLLGVGEGDEVITSAYTYTASASVVCHVGAKVVLADIEKDGFAIDYEQIENLITDKTKAIVPVHYAGVACEMDTIMAIAKRRKIAVIEDTAQGLYAYYKGKHLGTFGEFGALSFHSTKNVIAGEGGALICNNPDFIDRANFVREKGTNRIHFINGKIDKYTWVDYGSSYIPSELITAFLSAQLTRAKEFTDARIASWNYYYENLIDLEREGKIRLCKVPNDCKHNAHIFWATTESAEKTKSLLQYLKSNQIGATQHYAPLHNCPMAKKLGCPDTSLPIAEKFAQTMFRLPIYSTITTPEQDYVIKAISDFFKK
jgi:dTDP-4-amino-4,6-dideoxygalactose transaminase